MSTAPPAPSMNLAQNSQFSLSNHLSAADVATFNLALTTLSVSDSGEVQAGREISVYRTVSGGYSKGGTPLIKRIRTDAQGIVAKAHYPFTH